jgi:hypothetical protein
MRRIVLITLAVLVLASLALFFSGYGIRVGTKPCTYFVGIGTMPNFPGDGCPRFYKAIREIVL